MFQALIAATKHSIKHEPHVSFEFVFFSIYVEINKITKPRINILLFIC